MIKGVITFSCLPESSRRILPLLQYFNFHGLRQSSRRYVCFCRYVCIHRLSAARRKKKLQKKKNVSQVLETKFVIFIISRSRSEMRACGGRKAAFFETGYFEKHDNIIDSELALVFLSGNGVILGSCSVHFNRRLKHHR